MVDLELYRIFTIIANEENLTKASQILNISQPALTKHIKNLENELQITLFKRTRYGMQLTEYGQKLYNEIKDSINHLINVEKDFKKSRNINIGSHNTILSKIFSYSIKQFYKSYPTTTLNILNEESNVMLAKLENQELDIIFSKKLDESLYNTSKIKFIKLGFLHDVLFVNSNSHLLNKTLTKDDLKNKTIYTPRKTSETTKNLLKYLELNDNNVNIKNMKNPIMLELIKNDSGIGIISKEYIQEELKEQKIAILKTDFKLDKLEFGIYINKNNKFFELTNFIKIIQENISLIDN